MILFQIRIEELFIDNERIYIMELILAHHETFLIVFQYAFALFAGGWICFKWLFPMIGRGIVNLNYKMRMDGQRNTMRIKRWRNKRRAAKAQRKIDDSLSNPHRRAFYR